MQPQEEFLLIPISIINDHYPVPDYNSNQPLWWVILHRSMIGIVINNTGYQETIGGKK